MSTKYQTLVTVLDKIRAEAPELNKRYKYKKTDKLEKLNDARARALIHLYLKVAHGIVEFEDREKYITDDKNDGGIDAYYLDIQNKQITFIQSKFRTSEKNYENKEITFEELLKMDVDRVLDGEKSSEEGQQYNKKILRLIETIEKTPDISRYSYQVIILANVKKLKQSQLRKLSGGFSCEIFDYKRVYKELMLPVITGTFYNQRELYINIDLNGKTASAARINYNVDTEFENCDITVVFVPTEEVGKILYKYKNTILTYNPRCYLGLKTGVNEEIRNTIINKKTNEFALFNNGLTMLSDSTGFSDKVGKKGAAQIAIENPQIINGGQTAFTLSKIYESVINGEIDKDTFSGKEVLLKIITFEDNIKEDKTKKLKLIESISKATNRQSQVIEADRRANDKIQIEFQEKLFEKYGVYYERKAGEYSDGLTEKYITRQQTIDRDHFLRLATAVNLKPSQARRSSSKKLFEEENFNTALKNIEELDKYYYAYLVFKTYQDEERITAAQDYGFALRYGKYSAVLAAVLKYYEDEDSVNNAEEDAKKILKTWKKFENYVVEKKRNNKYFQTKVSEDEVVKEYNFDGYYKGSTVNEDIKNYFLST